MLVHLRLLGFRVRDTNDGFATLHAGTGWLNLQLDPAHAPLPRIWGRVIFFVDDVPGHVEGARAAGFDAIVYHSARQVADALRERGVRFNY